MTIINVVKVIIHRLQVYRYGHVYDYQPNGSATLLSGTVQHLLDLIFHKKVKYNLQNNYITNTT